VPIGEPRIIRDFLPPPAELDFHDEEVKVTIKAESAKPDTQSLPDAARHHRRRKTITKGSP